MEELLIEEKAKRYDSMFERLKEMYNNNKTNVAARLICERYFPELKECEDKMMIQYFKDLAPFDKAEELYEKYGFSHKDAIAWLEKQTEHAKFRNKIQIGDKVTRNEDGVLVNLSQLNRVAKKQGEQKPADTEKGANGNEREIPIPEPPLTIKHAKEVMGIKQNDAWSEEDEKCLENAIMYCEWARDIAPNLHCYETSEKSINWLKSLKERYTWKPSDEQMKQLGWIAKQNKDNMIGKELMSLYQDLKKLRGE